MKLVRVLFSLFMFLPYWGFAETCAKKGEEAYENPYQHPQSAPRCCKGLLPMRLFGYENGVCEPLTGPSSPCMPCGDGVCEYSPQENICNCPKDCKAIRRECGAEKQKIKLRNPLKIWSLEFLPLKCCHGLQPDTDTSETAICIKPKKNPVPLARPPRDFGFWQSCTRDAECTLVDEQPPCACGKISINRKFADAYQGDLELQKEMLRQETGPGIFCEPCKPSDMRKPQVAKCIKLNCRSLPSHH